MHVAVAFILDILRKLIVAASALRILMVLRKLVVASDVLPDACSTLLIPIAFDLASSTVLASSLTSAGRSDFESWAMPSQMSQQTVASVELPLADFAGEK